MNEALLELMLLAPPGEKHEALELGVLIALPVILALVLLRITSGRVANGAPAWQRWTSLVPLLVGIWLALDPFSDIQDVVVYRQFWEVSDQSAILHYVVIIVPCAATLGMIGYLLYAAHRERMER